MKQILVVGSGLDTILEKYPNVEVITADEAKERNIELSVRLRMDDIPILNHRDIPMLEDISISRKNSAQPWKRRGKNTKV